MSGVPSSPSHDVFVSCADARAAVLRPRLAVDVARLVFAQLSLTVAMSFTEDAPLCSTLPRLASPLGRLVPKASASWCTTRRTTHASSSACSAPQCCALASRRHVGASREPSCPRCASSFAMRPSLSSHVEVSRLHPPCSPDRYHLAARVRVVRTRHCLFPRSCHASGLLVVRLLFRAPFMCVACVVPCHVRARY